MICLQCKSETNNPKFCSRTCSAIYNNKIFPKRRTKKECIICGKSVKNYKHSRCEFHMKEFLQNKTREATLGEYKNKDYLKGKHRSLIYAAIRGFAKEWNKELKNKPCANCGYSKHVEICHKNPISEFEDDALLKDINSRDNLIQLCPNCHWEFDNGFLNIPSI